VGAGAGSGSGNGSGSGTGSGTGRGSGEGAGSGTGGGGASTASVDQPPRDIYANAEPDYPARERQLGVQAVVTVRLLLDESGRVVDVQVMDGPAAFRDAVMAKAWQWRFSPAIDEGHPVKIWVIRRIRFVIRG